jgi:hypothetical protein
MEGYFVQRETEIEVLRKGCWNGFDNDTRYVEYDR